MFKHFARVYGAQPAIPSAHIVTVEADATKGLHTFSIVGLPDKAVEEARDRVASAIKNSGYTSPKSSKKKIVISLAPAALKKEGAAFDVPIALSYLKAVGEIDFDTEDKLFAGELALDGTLRPIHGALSLARAAHNAGMKEIFVPHENAEEVSLVEGLTVYGVKTLGGLISHFDPESGETLAPYRIQKQKQSAPRLNLLEAIRGQEHAKRALIIAAAGRHNIVLFGPPGTGKTMLARALASLLPPLTRNETIEVTTIHSYAGVSEGGIIDEPPFRAPHHSSSSVALVGGGAVPKPGEVTLAHRGVLFLDEFPEFARDVVNTLRQPLEDRMVTVSRARGSQMFPANITLVAALNPCPCGHYGSQKCTCEAYAIERYRKKISGPIADRIDMWVQVGEIPPEDMKRRAQETEESDEARSRIITAHKKQLTRFKNYQNIHTNSDLSAGDIDALALLTSEAEQALITAAKQLDLSPRGYHRTIKLARTIADLAKSDHVEQDHMLEALQYRPKEF